MPISIEEFSEEFFQDIQGEAFAGATYSEDAFVDLFCASLIDAGELDTFDRAPYAASQGGIRIDGYGGDPIENEGVLNLVIADYNPMPELRSLTNTDLDAAFKRALNFVSKSVQDDRLRSGLDESAPAFGLADMIAARWAQLTKIRLILISNRILSSRVDGRDEGEIVGVPVTFSVWDLGRLHRYAISGQAREEIDIDLIEEFGSGLPALPAHLPNAGYESYLVVVPASQLAAIYDRWSTRLLEQNVRVFLQARGNVNKGIRNTIDNSPEMFFAYNNGITATAEQVWADLTDEGMCITRIKNLQIVNGGQTTASIHAASLRKIDLSNVFVQMKLSIVAPEDTLEVVPKISEYANSQNRVSAADFFSNHPFHVRMEEFSRRVFAPSKDGSFRESKWFYERARGQYQDARSKLTSGQRKRFDVEFPRKQVFTKTDLSKFRNVWRELPHVVSKGAQKNFADFAQHIGREWNRNSDEFNERFYRQSVAMAIVFRETEKIVSKQPWYDGGYRANLVAYAIARIGYESTRRKAHVDFDRIWARQAISSTLELALACSAKAAHDVLMSPPAGTRNISEWAKQQACWAQVMKQGIDWPEAFLDELVSKDEQTSERVQAVRDQRVLNGIHAQTAVVNAGAELWRSVLAWGNEKRLLTTTELGCLRVAASIPNRIPTEKQSTRVLEALKKLHQEGFTQGEEILA